MLKWEFFQHNICDLKCECVTALINTHTFHNFAYYNSKSMHI